LNPHAGEGGLFGREERTMIAPAVERARRAGAQASGPHPADSIFHRAASGEFDVVVAMYHDQGLIPLKLLHFHDGVNVTLGLPIVRTSPDHGTAYDIAGRGLADAGSMRAALAMAAAMSAAPEERAVGVTRPRPTTGGAPARAPRRTHRAVARAALARRKRA
jgi:4-hydroxythreonine-4-phosphate dehydrogenase